MTNELGSNTDENRISKAKGSFVLLNGHKTIRNKSYGSLFRKRTKVGTCYLQKESPKNIEEWKNLAFTWDTT